MWLQHVAALKVRTHSTPRITEYKPISTKASSESDSTHSCSQIMLNEAKQR